MTMIQNCISVFFDLDGTRHLNIAVNVLRFLNACTTRGLQLPMRALQRLMRYEHSYLVDQPQVERGRARFGKDAAFWEHFAAMQLRSLGLMDSVATHAAAIADGMDKDGALYTNSVPDDVLSTLQTLRDSGYEVGLDSNASNLWAR